MEWPQRIEARQPSPAPTTRSPMTTCCGSARSFPTITSASCSARSPIIWPIDSAPRARRSRCRPPAPRAQARSSSASRRSGAAKPTQRFAIGTDGSINPEALIRFSLLSALSTSNDDPQGAARPFAKNRDGFVMAEGAGALVLESYERRQGARRQDPRRDRRLRRNGGRLPPHALEPRRQADHRLHRQCHQGCRAHARRHRLHQRARHLRRRKTTRWNISASPPCSASA